LELETTWPQLLTLFVVRELYFKKELLSHHLVSKTNCFARFL